MNPASYITTSWDDGHPLDLRVAELLTKFGIRGTFYVPRNSPHTTMTPAEIRALTPAFELGAHTLSHAVLTRTTQQNAWQEISGSRSWIEDITGFPCMLFCPPKGRYAHQHLEMIRAAGYAGLRSGELMSLDLPRRQAGLLLMPTTVQAYPHHIAAFARNAIRRAALRNLWLRIVYGRATGWPELASSLLRYVLKHGGVFHLWGHSWELEETSQWSRLQDALRLLSELATQIPRLTNGQICSRYLQQTDTLERRRSNP